MRSLYKIFTIILFQLCFISTVEAQTINIVRFNNTASYSPGSGVSVIINPTGIFDLNNQFILELSNPGGVFPATPTVLKTLNEFYVPVINGTLPAGLAPGTYKLRVRSTNPVLNVETNSFTITNGGGIVIPSFKSGINNDGSSKFNCLTDCSTTQLNNIYGQIDVAANTTTQILNNSELRGSICNFDNNATYLVTLVNITNSNLTNLNLNTVGQFSIPNNLPIGTYVIEIEKKISNIISVFSNIFIFHGSATNINNLSSESVCVGSVVQFSIDTSSNGIGRNYLGSKYTIDFGDGSPIITYTHSQLLQVLSTPELISHTYNDVSCSLGTPPNIGYFIVKLKLFNKGVFNSGINTNYCNTYFENGNGADKRVNTSRAPVSDFNLPAKQCINSSITATNTTVLGQYGTTNCTNKPRYYWYVKRPTDTDFLAIDSSFNPSWLVGDNLVISASFVNIPGCWQIKLEAQNDGNGCSTTTEMIKTIKIEAKAIASFTNTPASPICPNTQIQFTNTSNVVSLPCQEPIYLWTVSPATGYQFVNPSNSASKDPLILFIDPAIYTVTLSVTNSCGTVTFQKTIEVAGSPTVSFNPSSLSICSFSPPSYTIDFSQSGTKPIYSPPPFAPSSYSWSVTGSGVTASDYAFVGGTTSSSQYPKITFTSFKTYLITVTVNGNCPGSGQATFTFVLKETPIITNSNLTQTICSENATTAIPLTSNLSGTTFNWTVTATSGITGFTTPGNGNSIPATVMTNPTNGVGTVTYIVTPTNNGCPGAPVSFVITVNPKPFITPQSATICSGKTFTVTPVNGSGNIVPVGTTYTWIDPISNPLGAITGGSMQTTDQTSISQNLTNTTSSPATLTYTVTPKSVSTGNCIGNTFTVTVTVNPTPSQLVLTDQAYCNGVVTTPIVFTNSVAGTTYAWTNSNTSIGLAASGTGDIPSFTAKNTTLIPTTATISVTPTSNGCIGSVQTFIITVNPSPTVTFNPGPQTICSGDLTAEVTLSSVAGATISWTAIQPAGITGVATSGTNTIPVQTLTNSTNAPIVITYEAKAESTSGNSCQGITYPYTITVNPVPIITTTQEQTICSNTSFSITPLDGGGNTVPSNTTYSWGIPVVTGGITGGASGTNQTVISGTLVNTTDAVQTATYTVTPKSGSCSGSSFIVTITVNPSPKVVFSGANQKICSDTASSLITLSSPTTGNVSFNWTATIPPGISGATVSGTDTIPIQTLINTSTTPLTVIYTATATFNNNGISCSGSPLDYKITVNPALITSSIESNYNGFNVSTEGASDGSIDVTVTGGSGSYTYIWSGPNGFSASTQDISNVPAGIYSLIINDVLCSPVTLDFTLTSPVPLIIQEDLSAHINVLCYNYATGAIKVDITQQSVGPYDYELKLQGGGIISSITNTTAINHTFTGLKAGTYDIKVTDTNGSVKIILGIIITEPSGITASITAKTNVVCGGDATGSATVTAIGGNGTLVYSWNTTPIQTTPTATGLTAGTYTVTITDANNCSVDVNATITEPSPISTSITSQTNVLCFGESTGSVTVVASGGTGILSYAWDTVPVQTTPTATGLKAGTYNLTVTDANNCSKVQSVTITEPASGLSSSISNFTDVSCFGGNDGNATASVSGGTAPYSYSWNTIPIQTSATATALKAGNYTVLITDSNGCGTSTNVTISEPVGMTASITDQTNVFCSGNSTGSATVTATGGTLPYSYSWNTNPIQTSDVAVNLAKGTYTVTVTDAKGCSATAQAIITEPNGIVTTINSQTNVDCYGNNTGAVTVLASGGIAPLSYSWDTIPVQTTPSLTGLIAGTYNLTVTDANNCSTVQTVIITEPNELILTIDSEKDITCYNAANGDIKITITGGTLNYTYAWTKDGNPFANTEDVSNLSPGTYQVTVSDANNCGPKTATFIITEPPILGVTLMDKTDILCFGESTGAINVTITGGTAPYTFAWTGPNGFTSSNQNLANVFAGTYNLSVTDNMGCTQVLNVTLTQPSEILISAVTTPITCYGANNASITLTITGGVAPYTVLWSNLGTGTYQDNLAAGDYLVTVTDAINCTKSLNINIPEAPLFTVNPVVKNISCYGANDGSIVLNFVGGVPPINLTWSDGSNAGTTRNNLKPGTYSVTIIDATPCTIFRTFTILEPQLLVLSANLTHALDCDNANSGSINLLVSGGSAPFTYSWSNGATTEDLANIPAGNYQVTVKDKNGCKMQAQYSINRPPPIVTAVETKTDFNCETKYVKQTFIAKVSGGVPPYNLVWSSGTVSGANNEIMNTDQNGTVILYATDAIGCKSNYAFNVDIPILGTPSFSVSSFAFTNYGNYSINDPIQFTNTSTGDFISMIWDFGDGTTSVELNPEHTYTNPKDYLVTQTVTYPLGCVYVHKITLKVEKGYILVVPNAFTPNSDSFNDTFRPVTKGLKNVRLDVYDTWGSMIFSETGDALRGWDGKIKGAEAENGNYYCKVSAKTFYGTTVEENHPFVLIK